MEATIVSSFSIIDYKIIVSFIAAIFIAVIACVFLNFGTHAVQTHINTTAIESTMQWTSDTSSWKQNW